MAKLGAFVAMYNDLMLAPSGLSKLEREMIAVAVSAHNRCYYCLVAHGASVRQLSGDPVLGELMVMNYRGGAPDAAQSAPCSTSPSSSRAEPWLVEERIATACAARASAIATSGTSRAVASFFNMSNRMAFATDMRPNSAYHAQAR